MEKLISEYNERKREIQNRLKEFGRKRNSGEKDIFAELCFCLLTPQSKAVNCDKAIKELKRKGLLFRGGSRGIKKILKGLVRFHNKKAEYLIGVRKCFLGGKKPKLKGKPAVPDKKIREWLVDNIKGLGYKEASHFLRNIGHGSDMAILDVHILRNLKRLGVLKKIPESINRKKYIELEKKMRDFSKRINIPLEELDLLFWSNETGYVFK